MKGRLLAVGNLEFSNLRLLLAGRPFILRANRSRGSDWVQQMEQALFAGIDYRHVIFPVPEQLRGYIEQCPRLLGELAKAGVATLTVVMSRAAG